MTIIDQLLRFGQSITALYSWILFLINQIFQFGHSVVMASNSWTQIHIHQLVHLGHYSITALNAWFQILIGAIAGLLTANLILIISLAISSQWTRKKAYQQPLTSTRPSIDTFIDSIEDPPRPPPKPKSKPPISENELWARQLQQQQQQQADDYNSNNDDNDPGETSLFAEDYISETEHNRALSILKSEISKLVKRITARDQLLQKSRAESVYAETQIDELRDEIQRLQAEVLQGKKVIDNLQVSHIEKGKLICELRAQLVRPTHEVPPEKMNPARWSGQAQPVSHQVHQAAGAAASESQQKRAKDVLTYIPPNRRPAANV